MTFLLPEVVIEAIEAAGIGGAAAAAVSISRSTLKNIITPLQSVSTIAEALSKVDSALTNLVKSPVTAQQQLVINIYQALGQAYKDGTVTPSESLAAVDWVFDTLNTSSINGSDLASGTFTGLLALWSIHQHHTLTTTTPPPKAAPAVAITVSPVAEATTTPGGKIVEQAQSLDVSVKINVPGLTAAQADAISKAIAASYTNLLNTLVGVTNALSAAVSTVGQLADTANGTADQVYKSSAAGLKTIQGDVTSLNKEITSINGELTTNLTRITNIEMAITQLDNDVIDLQRSVASITIPQAVAPPQPVSAPLPVLSQIPGYSDLANRLEADEVEIGGLAALLTRIGAPAATMTLEDLADCCAFNDNVTGPLNNYGIPKLLTELAILGILAGWLDAFFAILDTDDILLATAQEAEQVSGWIAQIAPTLIGDTSWADALASSGS